jgi:hypothetical protein
MATLAACDDTTGPDGVPTSGIDFGLPAGPGSHSAQGAVASANSPLDGEFAVAVPDSVGGLVLLSYDGATSDLFILQIVDAEPGEHTCGPVEDAAPCHARLFENVRVDDGVVVVDGRFDLVEGVVTLQTVGPDRVVGTFEARLDRTDPDGGQDFILVENGTLGVEYVDEQLAKGGLACLIALTGGGETCDQT